MDNLQNKPITDNFLLDEQSANSFQSLIIFNDNLRKHIKLSLSIYKKLNNFEHNYIRNILNDKSKTNAE
jgi:hypothetical protein